MCHTDFVPSIGTPTITIKRSDLKPKRPTSAAQLLAQAQQHAKNSLSEDEQAMLERMQARRRSLRSR